MNERTDGWTDQPTDTEVVNTVSKKEVCPFGVVERNKRDDKEDQLFPSTGRLIKYTFSFKTEEVAFCNFE